MWRNREWIQKKQEVWQQIKREKLRLSCEENKAWSS